MPWKWQCFNSRPKPEEDPEIEYIEVIKEKMLVPEGLFDTMVPENKWIEDSIAWIYWSDMAWIFGYLIQFILGPIVYGWISMEAIILLFKALETNQLGAYLMGPYRRAVNGWIIFTINSLLTLIPGVNFAAPFIMYEWAKADYYDYYTKIVPKPAEGSQ